jgi:aspartate/glutamate racemase
VQLEAVGDSFMGPAHSLAVDCTEFVESGAAIEAIHAYMRRLETSAADRRRRGEDVCDQAFPVEIFALRPARTVLAPLVLVGGMGPLAGAKGFASACSIFGESREILLLQACSIPDRTQAILADARSQSGISPEHVALTVALEAALREAISHVDSTRHAIDIIALCNAAHAFLPGVFARMRSDDVRLISLVECVVDALRRRSGPALILSSLGTRVSRIFTRRLDEAGIAYIEPSDRIQEALTRAIYDGLKALDWETASAEGEAVVAELLATNAGIGCIVAACTEIPPILDLLKRTGSEDLKEKLAAIPIIDPVELALMESAGAA